MLQLQAQLWLEQYLHQIQHRLNDLLVCEVASQKTGREVEATIWQLVVAELSDALATRSIAVVLAETAVDEYRIAYVAPLSAIDSINLNGKTLSLQVEQTIAIEDLQQLQNQQPQQAWQLPFTSGIKGWTIAIAASATSSCDSIEAGEIQLHERLIERTLAIVALAIAQTRQIQAIALKCEQLESHNRELRRANQLKSEFLANTSHEIRTPLSSILGFTHLMLAQGYNPGSHKHQEYLTIILHSGQHLLELINDILDLSKIEADRLEVNKERVNVAALCRNALALVKEKAQDKGLQLQLDLDPQAQEVIADPLRLKQMLFNLLSNAVKFTSHGAVGLKVECQERFIHFTVWDTGIGIAPEEQVLLFQPYRQLPNRAVKSVEGTGLGLALTQKLAELHGGTVKFQSRSDRGSQFTIVIPYSSGLREEELRELRELGEQRSGVWEMTADDLQLTRSPILVVEDNEHNAKLISTYLKKLGYQVEWVQTAARMWRVLPDLSPGLILMDIQLPDVDGLTLVRQLKADERYKDIPTIAQTAMAMKGDRELCLAAGATEYISKPIDLKLLAALVAKYRDRGSEGAVSSEQ